MKIAAFLLSIYILALNFSSCEDNDACNDEVKTQISQLSNDGHSALDLCSPFCQCHCCQIHVTNFIKVDCEIASSDISTEVFFHFNGLEKDFKNFILQPPRV